MHGFNEGALVIYKGKPAIVNERTENKFTISLKDGSSVKVRDKDIELLHPGPVKSFNFIEENHLPPSVVKEVWELLSGESESLSLKDLTAFIFNEYTAKAAYSAYLLLCDGLYFSGSIDVILPRSKEDVLAEETKRASVQRETGERSQFLDRLKACLKKPAENKMHDDDARYLQDVEALAFGKTARSRTMRDIGLGETPEDAHSLLLKTGFWTGMINPHPSRFGLSLATSTVCPSSSNNNDSVNRKDLTHLAAYAIDSPWSTDPDDAVSVEVSQAGISFLLYVHVADPSSLIGFDSPAEKEARDRGATLYLPEGVSRMLADECIPMFALGISEKSLALTFQLSINENGIVTDTEIYPSIVKVQRLTYEEADKMIDAQTDSSSKALGILYNLSKLLFERRIFHGAVNIELPDVNITVRGAEVTIDPIIEYRSSFMVKESMIAAGEGAGTWAASRALPFPYISQEVEIQGKVAGGLAGSIQLRKCMRPRILSVKPGRHQGLGLDTYTQVTSPLRRYTDLLSHLQIRAVLSGGKPLSADEISARLGFSEAGVVAAVHAERASDSHWKMVYLSDKKESLWDAVAVENKGRFWAVIIPALALEAQVTLQRDVALNDNIKLSLKSVNIAKGEAVFQQC
ncbi:MAG: ribonuclease catalytic domain-containing protein [Treponema sp.]|nr:ribonuclease catalytic domain-containing protein [Treponema sp.]